MIRDIFDRFEIWFLIGVVVGAIVTAALFLSTPARAEECPLERPFKRVVDDPMSGFRTCTLVYCSPWLVCPAGIDRCSYESAKECNTCSPKAQHDVEICLSKDEIDRAK